jgi:rfaE bifunctional protein kinase chain/domain
MPKKSVFVLGDIVLDCYIDCYNQFSNNEKIQKLAVQSKKYIPGNAANVANNLSALGVDVHLFGVIGRDVYGDLLTKELNPAIKNHILQKPTILTPLKSRFISEEEMLIRIDEEIYAPLLKEEETKLFTLFHSLRNQIEYLIIADLNKGTFSDAIISSIITKAIEYNIQVFIDPSFNRDLNVYKMANVLSPNLDEFNGLNGTTLQNIKEASSEAKKMLKTYNLDYVLLKGDQSGSLLVSNHFKYHLPSLSNAVVSTIGAGDSFLAAFTASMIESKCLKKSFEIANVAASISVSKQYTSLITKSEIHHFFQELKTGGDYCGFI